MEIEIYQLTGVQVEKISRDMNRGYQRIEIPMAGYKKGIYFLKVNPVSGTQILQGTVRLMKQ